MTAKLIAVLALFLCSCPNAQRAGWIATAATIDARDAVDEGINQAFNARVIACKEQHLPDQVKFQECVRASREFHAVWKWLRDPGVWGMLNAAVRAAKGILEIAAHVQASESSTTQKVLSALRESVCALAGIVRDFGHLWPKEAKPAMQYLDLIKAVCK